MQPKKAVKIYAPDVCDGFRCLAGACRHTCCEGWEIDIDPESLARYRSIPGEFGRKLMRCVDPDPTPHFILTPEEKCPLLTEDHLCELILREGEDALCQICADHPRFRNYWSDRVEMGLGLACEEAARLILTCDHPIRLREIGEDPSSACEEPDEGEIRLRELRERLWASAEDSGPAARLYEYMIYRHLADALYDGLTEERIRFAGRACGIILDGWDGSDIGDLIERARRFSNEIEYDDEKLIEMIRES